MQDGSPKAAATHAVGKRARRAGQPSSSRAKLAAEADAAAAGAAEASAAARQRELSRSSALTVHKARVSSEESRNES